MYATRLKTDVETAAVNFVCVVFVDMVDSQRQQTEERALKMKSVLVKTKKELAEAKKQVSRRSPNPSPLKSSILTPYVIKINGRNLMGLDLIRVCLLFTIKTIVIHCCREYGLYRALPFIYVLSKNSNH